MKIIFNLLLLLAALNVTAQVTYFKTIEKSNDSLADLRYFKNLEKPIIEKLDSFFLFIKGNKGYKKKFKKDKGFIQFSMHKSTIGRVVADISVNAQYVNYKIFASKKNNFGDVFAFAFYKSKLILFTLPYSNYRIKEAYAPVLHDLMYAEFKPEVKKEIDCKTEDFQIEGLVIVKRYYLD